LQRRNIASAAGLARQGVLRILCATLAASALPHDASQWIAALRLEILAAAIAIVAHAATCCR